MSNEIYTYAGEYDDWVPEIPEKCQSLHWYNGELYRDFRMFVFSTEKVEVGQYGLLRYVKIYKNTPNLPLYELRELDFDSIGFLDAQDIIVQSELWTPYTFLNGQPLLTHFPETMPNCRQRRWHLWHKTFYNANHKALGYERGSWVSDVIPPDFNIDLPMEKGRLHVYRSTYGLAISRDTPFECPMIEKFRQLTG